MKSFLIKAVAVLLLLLVVGGALWYTINKSPSLRFGTDRAAVITQVQSLSQLETASFTIDKIIEAGTDYNKINQLLFGDKLLLVAHGEVIAGYDLSKIKPEDFPVLENQLLSSCRHQKYLRLPWTMSRPGYSIGIKDCSLKET